MFNQFFLAFVWFLRSLMFGFFRGILLGVFFVILFFVLDGFGLGDLFFEHFSGIWCWEFG